MSTPQDTTMHARSKGLSEVLRSVFQTEANAILQFGANIDDGMNKAAELIYQNRHNLIVSGIGKSGHIGRKIASTFCSLGKPAVFLHAAEASHGDLGMINKNSVLLVLSNSGETPELVDLLGYAKRNDIPMISITSQKDSTLARNSQIAIAYGKLEEACINGLAPTTSTTLALAIGDALAVGFSHLSGIEPKDFRQFHPGGKLGAQLLSIKDLMHKGDELPVVKSDAAMSDVVITMSEKSLGVVLVDDGSGSFKLITDGDLRRNAQNLWDSTAQDLLSTNAPKTLPQSYAVSAALSYMTDERINCVLVEDENQKICGLLTMHDCLRAGFGA